ncbi:MAG: hypothetical protein K0R84_2209 [Clostridia bacterium]|jgi:hypothetical protein|nr:hypothetical protein [Clostridia bacterium]
MYNQYRYPYEGQTRQAPMTSHIRVLHASPDAPGVDVYVNNNLAARDVTYREFTPYIPIAGGLYNITVYRTGTRVNPIINTNVNIPPRSIFTVAATGRLADIELTLVPEPPIQRQPGRSYIRVVHLSPGSPNVDLYGDGTRLFSDIEYEEISTYVGIRPGRHEFQVRVAGTNNTVLTVPNINLRPNKIYTLYIIGLAVGTPGLQMLIPLDGSTYLPM